ncbi:hypothetical protein, partial [Hymenobacter sp. BT190]|uniref:hypothetical protein n=1 Tax=Hymenobacter sp. BT190 TaxID=2763505 RepID=UPI001C9E1C59
TESLSPGAPMVLPSSVGESVAANLTVFVARPGTGCAATAERPPDRPPLRRPARGPLTICS